MKKCAMLWTIILTILFSATLALAQEQSDYLISWAPNPEPDIAGYVIYRSLNPASNFSAIDSVDAATHAYIDAGLDRGIRYYYRVVAKNASGARSALSNSVSGFTIPQNASQSVKDQCRVTGRSKISDGLYQISWSTTGQTIGFVQYDRDLTLDSLSAWDDATYGTTHQVTIDDVSAPYLYFLRAASYDSDKNMTLSALDTIVTGEAPAPPTSPLLSIYPVPYRPAGGNLTMSNLPAFGSSTVYDSTGLEVWRGDVGSDGSLRWDGKNAQGSPVASGVYYVVVKNKSGTVVEKRPIMIVK